MKNSEKLTMMEIVVIAVIAVVMGIISLGIDAIYMPLATALGPYGSAVIYGIYFVSSIIPMYIVRKPGASLLGSLFTGIMNILLGSPYGIHIVVAQLCQGLGIELGCAMFKYKRFDFVPLAIGAVIGMLLKTARDYFVFGFGELGSMMPIITIIRCLSAAIIGGFVTILLGKALLKTGVLKEFKIAKDQL